jgi:hypothetical protein
MTRADGPKDVDDRRSYPLLHAEASPDESVALAARAGGKEAMLENDQACGGVRGFTRPTYRTNEGRAREIPRLRPSGVLSLSARLKTGLQRG